MDSKSKQQASIKTFFTKKSSQVADRNSKQSLETDKHTDIGDNITSVSTDIADVCDTQNPTSEDKTTDSELKRKLDTNTNPVKINVKKIKTYKFKEEWKKNRDWLHYDEIENSLSCAICQKYDKSGRNNSFRSGCKSIRLSVIEIHQTSDAHLRSEAHELAQMCKNKSVLPLEKTVLKMQENEIDTMKMLFTVAYWVAKNEKPFTDSPKMIELLNILGTKLGHTYANDKKAREFIGFISESFRQEIVADLHKAEFFSVLCDGSTDCSVLEQEIMYVRYIKFGQPKTVFVCASHVERGDALHIKEAILKMLDEKLELSDDEEWKSHLVGLCFDGAAVMMGCKSGVAKRIQTLAPHVVAIHCCAHRLELAVKDVTKQVPYLADFDESLVNLYKFYKYSPLRWQGLKAAAEALNVNLLRPVRILGVRWLPHHERAVKAVSQSYEALAVHLENEAKTGNKENQEKSRCILSFLQTLKFVMVLNFLTSFLGVMSKVSKAFQCDKSGLHSVHDSVEKAVAHFEKLTDRDRLTDVMMKGVEVGEGDNPEYKFHGMTLSVPERGKPKKRGKQPEKCSEKESALKAAEQVIEKIKTNLASRYDVKDDVCGASYVFNPNNFPKDPDALKSFGDSEIQLLSEHFERPLTARGYDPEATVVQWLSVKKQIVRILNFEDNLKFGEVWERILTTNDQKGENKDILALVRIVISMLVNSAVCERGFSLMKRVKSDWRGSLKNDSLSDLLTISVNGPPTCEYDPDAAIALWLTQTKRRAAAAGKRSQTQVSEEAWSSDESD